MTDWIDFFIYAVLLITLFSIYPWTLARLSIPMLVDRNSQWCEENSKTIRGIERIGNWLFWLNFVFGIVCLTLLTKLQIHPMSDPEISEKWALLWNLNFKFSSLTDADLNVKWNLLHLLTVISMLISILFSVVLSLIVYFALIRKIPIAEKRQADLQRRTINDYVPFSIKLATYSLIFIMLAACVLAALFGWYDIPNIWKTPIRMLAASGFIYFCTSYAIERRPNILDRLFGTHYRRTEVLMSFSLYLLPLSIGTFHLNQEFVNVMMDFNDARAIFLGSTLFATFSILWFGYQVAKNLSPHPYPDNTLVKHN